MNVNQQRDGISVSGAIHMAVGTIGFGGFGAQKTKSGQLFVWNDGGVWKGKVIWDVHKDKENSGIPFTFRSKNTNPGSSLLLKLVTCDRALENLYIQFTDGSAIKVNNMKNKQHTKAMDTRLNEIRNMQSITGQSAARPVMPVLAPTFSRSSTTIPTKSPAQKQKGPESQSPSNSDRRSPTETKSKYFSDSETDRRRSNGNKEFLVNGLQKSSGSFYGTPNGTVKAPPSIPNFRGAVRSETVRRPPHLLPTSNQSRWVGKSEKNKQLQLQGFSNLGNTCYMNVILQSLFACPTFSADLWSLFCKVRNRKLCNDNALYWNLAKLLKLRKNHDGGVDAEHQRRLLNGVKGAISVSAKRFSGHQQHDAHEFLGQVLDQLKEEADKLNKDHSGADDSGSSDDEARVNRSLLTGEQVFLNPTSRNFEFEVLHTITCTNCAHKTRSTEPCNDLLLTLPRRRGEAPPTRLQDLIDIYFKAEDIEYSCEHCDSRTAHVRHVFTKLPRIMIVHLKRYSFHRGSTTNTKTAQQVDMHRFLTLRAQCEQGTAPPAPPSPATFSYISKLKEARRTKEQVQQFNNEWRAEDLAKSVSTAINGPSTPKTVRFNGDRRTPNSSYSFKKTKSTTPGKTDDTWLNSIGKDDSEEFDNEELHRVTEAAEKEFESEKKEQSQRTWADVARAEKPRTNHNGFYDEKDVPKLTEEEAMEWAIKQSLKESMPPGGAPQPKDAESDERAQKSASPCEEVPEHERNGHLGDEQAMDSQTRLFSSDDECEPQSVPCVDGAWDEETEPSVNSSRHTSPGADGDSHHADPTHCDNASSIVGNDYLGSSRSDWFSVISLDGTMDVNCEAESPVSSRLSESSGGDHTPMRERSRKSLEQRKRKRFSLVKKTKPGTPRNRLCFSPAGQEKQSGLGEGEKKTEQDMDGFFPMGETSEVENSDGGFNSEDGDSSPRFNRQSGGQYFGSVRKRKNNETDELLDQVTGGSAKKHSRNTWDLGANAGADIKREEHLNDPALTGKTISEELLTATEGCATLQSALFESPPRDGASHRRSRRDDATADKENSQAFNCVTGDLHEMFKNNPNLSQYWAPRQTADDKENRTPPGEEEDEPTVQLSLDDDDAEKATQRRRSREEEDMQKAINASLQDQQRQNRADEATSTSTSLLNGMSEEEALRKAIDMSLQEVSTNISLVESDPEESFEENEEAFTVHRTEEEERQLSQNMKTGNLEYSYQLVSVVSHLGVSSKYGHYVCDAYDFVEGSWRSFDDSRVQPIRETEMYASRASTGYIFFYADKLLIQELEEILKKETSTNGS